MSNKCVIDRQRQLEDIQLASYLERAKKRRRLASHEYRPAPWLGIKPKPKPPSPVDAIINGCAARYGVSPANILGKNRKPRLVEARQAAMYDLAACTNLSLADIGRVLGDRDHTTVMHGIARHCQKNGLEKPR